ncbi:uncharacterized protein LOC116850518 isoform X2 [Odontomachus brunneus]|uniref:uncharacterized protein LOC116850518 isoform X2 n=1 Tax=Odontomachus brunneus TaxID=486640 RepID=UPI0013F1811D|nr:uncharacterized protein LOC116850518 isoform X2 [Odontomachus brunneus]
MNIMRGAEQPRVFLARNFSLFRRGSPGEILEAVKREFRRGTLFFSSTAPVEIIMSGVLTIERIIAFLKVDLTFACCWPLSADATRCQRIWDKVFRCLCCLNGMIMVIALWYTLFTGYTDTLLVMKVSCELSACIQVPMQITLFTLESDRLQVVISEMENYIQQAKSEEKGIFQRYVDKCKLFYGVTLCWITITMVAMDFGPLLLPQPFPVAVHYPFHVENQLLKIIIYLHHIMVVYQCYVQVCANVFVALLLWFVAARFEILSGEFRKATSLSEFMRCIRLHQQLLGYARDVTRTVRYVTVTSIGFSTVAVIFSGLTFLSSSNIAHAAYDSLWYNEKISLRKSLLYVVLRSHKPVILSVPCMLPALSLNYYASYLSTTFSYLTTFRAIFAEDGLQI